MKISDELLVAFADGELDPAEAARVEAALTSDPALSARLDQMRAARSAVKAGMATPEVPDVLVARVRALAAQQAAAGNGKVVELSSRRPAPAPRPIWQLPFAAAIALAVGATAGWIAGTGPENLDGLAFAGLDDGDVARFLDTLPSGKSSPIGADEQLAVISSFRDQAGTLCREFEIDSATSARLAVACANGPAWDLRFVAATAPDAGGYAPASSTEALDVWLETIGASGALEPGEEEAALAERLR